MCSFMVAPLYGDYMIWNFTEKIVIGESAYK
nr:MAG TPA: hypothetical protein [Caudoviricetes sp.]